MIVSCMILLHQLLIFWIQSIRVKFPHGAACQTERPRSAAGALLTLPILQTAGLIRNSRAVASKMNASADDFVRCSNNFRALPAKAYRWRARTAGERSAAW